MYLATLRGRLTWLFVGFFLLVSVSAALTFWSLETQRGDAAVLNLAGRQRMLVQQMTRAALESAREGDTAPLLFNDARTLFDQTLTALRFGVATTDPPLAGQTLLAARTPQIDAQLARVASLWTAFDVELQRLLTLESSGAERQVSMDAVDRHAAQLLAEADAAVQLYQEAALRKVNRLRALQGVFLTGALALLLVGGWLIRSSVLEPLQQLDLAASGISDDDLATPVRVTGPDEITLVARTLETMRARLQASRAELLQLAANLEARVAQRTRELDALNDVSREISAQLDVQEVLDSVTEKAQGLLEADVASLCLLDDEGQWMHLRALSGPAHAVCDQAVPADAGFAPFVLHADGALACADGGCHGGCSMLAEGYRISHLAAPLRRGTRVVGALCVGSPQAGRFSSEAASVLTKLANTAAVALENARLYTQAERIATLEERGRIAAEMHDGLAQTLSYLGLMTDQVVEFLAQGQDAEALQRLHAARGAIEEATAGVRCAIDHLLDDGAAAPSLATRLQTVAGDLAGMADIDVRCQAEAPGGFTCPVDGAEQVVNITREALSNAIRHAEARHVHLLMGRNDGHCYVTVQDDGKGFDINQPEPPGHFGLKVMRARAAHMGGQLEIASAPQRGTRITLTWPVSEGG